ncbi:MAG: MBL fold metallo-hydrolase [Myxococcales bacterium]|nr:MBL fold metallo-hydrolase [Myxococcales bacterium]
MKRDRLDDRMERLRGFSLREWTARTLGANFLPIRDPVRDRRAVDARHGVEVTWIGHATILVDLPGFRFITDPFLTRRVVIPRRLVHPGRSPEELQDLNAVLVTHAHMDHLDIPSHRLLPRNAVLVTPPKVSRYLRRIGYRAVHELGWWETVTLGDGVEVTAVPAKHWGTRGLLPDGNGYGGYVVRHRDFCWYFAGDTAYFDGFHEIGRRFSIDLACLPIGAYHPPSFREVHMNPEDAYRAFIDLGAAHLLPVHFETLVLSMEPIGEPRDRIEALRGSNGHSDRVHVLSPGMSLGF